MSHVQPTKSTLCKCGHRYGVHSGTNGCFPHASDSTVHSICNCKGFEAAPANPDERNKQDVQLCQGRVYVNLINGMSPDDALNLAAWLVQIADGKGEHTFDEIREVVEATAWHTS
jgi:hypothetical protein